MKNDHGRGTIRDNALAALVTSKAYQAKMEKPKKGKGSYMRKSKYKNSRKYSYREFFIMWGVFVHCRSLNTINNVTKSACNNAAM